MSSPEDRVLLTQKQDRLIELFVLHDEANRAEEWDSIYSLETEIKATKASVAALRQIA